MLHALFGTVRRNITSLKYSSQLLATMGFLSGSLKDIVIMKKSGKNLNRNRKWLCVQAPSHLSYDKTPLKKTYVHVDDLVDTGDMPGLNPHGISLF